LGHEAVIRRMLEECEGEKNCIVVIGSSNAPVSMRHFFSYSERRDFLLRRFPNIRVVGLPDYNNDVEWMLALDDILRAASFHPITTTFFGGCDEDVRYFVEAGRQVQILNRFDGSTPRISATEVRDALIHERSLKGLMHPDITDEVQSLFRQKWEKFVRT